MVENPYECPACKGLGYKIKKNKNPNASMRYYKEICPKCKGKGILPSTFKKC